MFAREVFVVDAKRTPIGKRGGMLADVHPSDLLGDLIAHRLRATGLEGEHVDEVIMGCVNAVGAQSGNIARTAWLAAGLANSVGAVTVDRRCGSGLQAVTFGAQSIASGMHEIVMTGGVENMSMCPLGSADKTDAEAPGRFDGRGWGRAYSGVEISQFASAERMALAAGYSRSQMEEFALRSHELAVTARRDGLARGEVVPVADRWDDEGPRPSITSETLAGLPTLRPGGVITAATACPMSDAAAVVLLASANAVQRYGLDPIARISAASSVGVDPVRMLDGPIPATSAVLARAGLAVHDVDRFEVNEAFAPVVMLWRDHHDVPLKKVNVRGGALALGHPLGATGARLLVTLIDELRQAGLQRGLVAMCEGAGTSQAMLVEVAA